jgi:hypothetical protein
VVPGPMLCRSGLIDPGELRRLLECTSGGLEDTGMRWLTDEMVSTVLQSYDINADRGISFEEYLLLVRAELPSSGQGVQAQHMLAALPASDGQPAGSVCPSSHACLSLSFCHPQNAALTLWCLAQVQDGILLEGTLDEYRAAFSAVDTSGNGTIGDARTPLPVICTLFFWVLTRLLASRPVCGCQIGTECPVLHDQVYHIRFSDESWPGASGSKQQGMGPLGSGRWQGAVRFVASSGWWPALGEGMRC